MNKFKYSESDNKLLLDIPRPVYGDYGSLIQYNGDVDEWNSRLSYSLSPELKARLTNGQVLNENEFEAYYQQLCGMDPNMVWMDCTKKHYDEEKEHLRRIIAIPLPEQTKPIQDWKDSELAKVTDRMKADLDRLAYLEERVKTLEKYETAALKLAAFNWKESQTSKVKEPERLFTLEDDDVKCVPGCKHYTGGEIRHHKTCPFYPDSLSIKYDELDRKASQEWFTIQDVLLAFDAGNKRGAYPISIGHNPHPNKEDYVKQTFGIDIQNNQPSNT